MLTQMNESLDRVKEMAGYLERRCTSAAELLQHRPIPDLTGENYIGIPIDKFPRVPIANLNIGQKSNRCTECAGK